MTRRPSPSARPARAPRRRVSGRVIRPPSSAQRRRSRRRGPRARWTARSAPLCRMSPEGAAGDAPAVGPPSMRPTDPAESPQRRRAVCSVCGGLASNAELCKRESLWGARSGGRRSAVRQAGAVHERSYPTEMSDDSPPCRGSSADSAGSGAARSGSATRCREKTSSRRIGRRIGWCTRVAPTCGCTPTTRSTGTRGDAEALERARKRAEADLPLRRLLDLLLVPCHGAGGLRRSPSSRR